LKKRQKKTKNDIKKGKKRKKSGKKLKKVKKWYVYVQKSAQNCTPDTNASFNVKMGKIQGGQNCSLKMRVVKMLKWGI